MGIFFGDSFDLYPTGNDMISHWDATSLNPNSSGFSTGRFGVGRSLNMSSSSRYHKVSGSNDSVHHFSMAMRNTNLTGSTLGTYCELDDGTTAQCSVVFRSDGAILLTQGGPTGSALALWTGALSIGNIWYVFEIEVVVHNTNGSIAIRRNGSPVNDFFLGGLDTAATASNYANRLVFGSQSFGSYDIDDFLWRSDTASVPWIGDVRCYTRYPATDISTQFSKSTVPTSTALNGAVGIMNTFNAGYVIHIKFSPGYNGLVTGASLNCNIASGGGIGHVKVALYAANAAGGIGSVLAVSSEVTNPGIAIISFTFPTPVRVVQGQSYWIAVNQDANIGYNVSTLAGVIVLTGQTYATWPTSNPGGTAGGGVNIPGNFTVIITPELNADTVSEPRQDALTTYVYSSTNGQADLYSINSIGVIPVTTFGIMTRGYFTKSDAGTRSATIQVKSGSTTVQGPSTTFVPGTWTWVERTDTVDPATGVAWTAAGVNGVQVGPVITS